MNKAARALLICLVSALVACDGREAYIDRGEALLTEGHFDAAFEQFRIAYRIAPDDSRILAGFGSLLTLRRGSMFAGIRMLEESLGKRWDPEVHERLILLYVSIGAYDQAIAYVREPHISINQMWTPEITRLRNGVACLRRPGTGTIRELERLPPHPRRDYFLVLCYLETGDADAAERALELYNAIDSTRTRCELLSVWPTETEEQLRFVQTGMERCRAWFPGMLALHRQRPDLPELEGENLARHDLFTAQPFDPEDQHPQKQRFEVSPYDWSDQLAPMYE